MALFVVLVPDSLASPITKLACPLAHWFPCWCMTVAHGVLSVWWQWFMIMGSSIPSPSGLSLLALLLILSSLLTVSVTL